MKIIKLYRYLSADAAINTIESGRFRVGRILEMNDPFEWSFGFEADGQNDIEDARLNRERTRTQLHETFGLLCFCAVSNDPVIWSHYAAHHRGLALCLKIPKKEVGKEIYKVKYQKKRIRLPILAETVTPQQIATLRQRMMPLFRRKAPSWKYEQEYRGVISLAKCEVKQGMYLWPIPKELLSCVILGIQSAVSPAYLRRALDLHGFSKTKVFKAIESLSSYKVLIRSA